MKTKKLAVLTLSAAAVLTTVLVSCKKEDPVTPINKDVENTPPCSFCPGESMMLSVDNMISETYAIQAPFYHYNGTSVTPQGVAGKTPTGYYDWHGGFSIAFNFAELPLACVSNKITFAHARFASNTNDDPSLINVQFPGTPLIVTVPDSLNYYLSPYGYTVQHFFQPGIVHQDSSGSGSFVGVVDSLIITGPEFETVTIGANLFESELRSICVSHQ